jgi:hypothetical protein
MSGLEDTDKAEAVGPGRAGGGPGGEEKKARRILHVDMDAFFASIEQRDFPDKYAGEPIAVGGNPPKGVVKAASYEARPYGVHSAQPAIEADRQCPDLIFVSPRMEVYQEESRRIRSILHTYTDLIEPLSLDEAFLDVTAPKKGPPSGTLIARRIREEIYGETGLTASAGVGPSKFVAKVASDQDKPDGLTVVRPETQMEFIADLPIGDFHGIGPVTEEKMWGMGIETGADLQETSEKTLQRRFGKRGGHLTAWRWGRMIGLFSPTGSANRSVRSRPSPMTCPIQRRCSSGWNRLPSVSRSASKAPVGRGGPSRSSSRAMTTMSERGRPPWAELFVRRRNSCASPSGCYNSRAVVRLEVK